MNSKLPFLKIIAAAVFFAWTNKAELLKAIAAPTLLLVVVWGLWLSFADELPSLFTWILLLSYGLSFSFLAVTCHRLILIGGDGRCKSFNGKPGYRELRFLAWVIVIYAIKSILEFVARVPVQYVSSGLLVEDGGSIADWVEQIASIPALYVLGRLSLVFPAAAIDKDSSLRWSWIRTYGNGWRIFIIVGLFPWLIGMAIGAAWREDATVLEQVVLSILAYVGLAIEIIALSFTYKELAKQYAAREQLMPQDSFHDLALGGKGHKLDVAVKTAVGFVICYLLIGSLMPYAGDCSSEVISQASSPDSLYKAELLNRTCKDDKDQGLILNIVRTTSPKTISSHTISKTISNEADLVWTSNKSLLVKHAKALNSADAPTMIDEVQIVFE